MMPSYHLNLATKLWQIIGANFFLRHAFLEYFRLATMALILVLGSVEDVATQDRVFPHYVPNSSIRHSKSTLKIVPKRFCEV
jgi:hypothetical protein